MGPALLVLGDEARENGLKDSLLERLSKLYSSCDAAKPYMVQLNNNYRCHKEIMAIPNKLFYNNKIIATEEIEVHPLAPYPMMCVCTSLDHKVNPDLESRLLLDEVQKITETWPKEWLPYDRTDVAFITSSRTQVIIQLFYHLKQSESL